MEEVDFLDLLEKEEADFAEQIRKQKSFLQVGRRWAVLGIQNLQERKIEKMYVLLGEPYQKWRCIYQAL